MTTHRGSTSGTDGLRDTVFQAIQGFPDRVSMSPAHRIERSSSHRVHSSRQSASHNSIRSKEAFGSFTSLSMRDTDPWDECSASKMATLPRRSVARSVSIFEHSTAEGQGNVSTSSARSSSMSSLAPAAPPSIVITQADIEPQPQIRKAPPAKDVTGISKETRAEWVHACRKGLVDKCKKMLDEKPELANYTPPYYYGYAALHMATVGQWRKLIELLHHYGADLDAQTSSGNTALHLAAQSSDKDTIRLLTRLGANPCLKDLQGHLYKFYLKEDEKDVILRDNNNKSVVRPRPASQGALDTTTDSRNNNSFLRGNSFRDAMKKFVRRSPSPAYRS